MGGWCSKRNVPTKGTACIQYSQQSSYFSAGCLVSETEYLAQIYGLYSPVSLISYLFPSVKMGTYIMVSMVVSLIAAVLVIIVLTAGLFVQQYQSDECCAKVLRTRRTERWSIRLRKKKMAFSGLSEFPDTDVSGRTALPEYSDAGAVRYTAISI